MLARMLAFMQEHDNLQNSFPCFHVGGTNGKGSTAAILDAVLKECGLKVGRFTGPHLLCYNERLHVNGKPIDNDKFVKLVTRLKRLSTEFAQRHGELGRLTWFEFITCLAFFYFYEEKVDVAIFEVGLGGRFDATNIIENVVAGIITNVDLDHMHILGNSVSKIAKEKAGIIKPGVPVFTAATGDALAVLKKQAEKMRSQLVHCSLAPATIKSGGGKLNQGRLRQLASAFADTAPELALGGEHQQLNALLVFASLRVQLQDALSQDIERSQALSRIATLPDPEFMRIWRLAVKKVYWPGRLQYLPAKKMILDVAHNPHGIATLRKALAEHFAGRRFFFVFGCFNNKNASEMLQALVKKEDRLIVSEAITRRSTFAKERLLDLADELGIKAYAEQSVADACAYACANAKQNEIIIVTGSFAVVREAMIFLGWQSVEDGCRQAALQIK